MTGAGAAARRAAVGPPAVAALLLALALGAALAFVFAYPLPEVRNDAVEYLALARSVAAGTGFSADGGRTPYAYRPPLFSVLLGAWFRSTGTTTVLSAALFQSIIHALSAPAALLLFLLIGLPTAHSAVAAAFLAVHPLLVTRAAFVLQEPTVLLATVLAACASVRLVRAPSTGGAALAGAAWGVCTLAKVACGFAPLLLLGMRLLPERLRWSWRGREAALFLLCFAAVIAPWTVRNGLRFQRFIPVNDQARGVLEWNVEHVDVPGERSGAEVLAEIKARGLPEAQEKAALRDHIVAHPRSFLVDRTVRNALVFIRPARDWWWSRGRLGPGERRPWYWGVHDALHWSLYLFLLYRTARWAWGREERPTGLLILFYWAYWLEHALVWSSSRYGLAVYPILLAVVLGGGASAAGAAAPDPRSHPFDAGKSAR